MPVDSTYHKYYDALQNAYGKDGSVEKGSFSLGYDDFKTKLSNQGYAQKIYSALNSAYGPQGVAEKNAFTLPFNDFYSKLSGRTSTTPNAPSAPPPAAPPDHIKDMIKTSTDNLHEELTNNNDLIPGLVKKQKEQNKMSDNLTNLESQPRSDQPMTSAQMDAQRLAPKQSPITVDKDEVAAYGQNIQDNNTAARAFLKHIADSKPDKAAKIKSSTYVMDAISRNPNDPAVAQKVYENAQKIQQGDLDYHIQSGQLVKPENALQSALTGWRQKNKELNDYDTFSNATPQQAISELEKRRAAYDPNNPIPVPNGFFSQLTEGLANQPFKGLVAGKIGGIATTLTDNPELAPAVDKFLTAAVSGNDFRKMSYANGLQQHYNDLRNQGTPADQAYEIANKQARDESQVDAVANAAMMYVGGKIGEGSLANLSLSNGFKSAVVSGAKGLMKTGGEAGAVGLIQGEAQQIKNDRADANGVPRDHTGKDIGSAIEGGTLFTLGIGLLAKGGERLASGVRSRILQGMSTVSPDKVDAELGEQILQGKITPDEAVSVKQQIDGHSAIDKTIPGNISDENRVKINDHIADRAKLEQQLDTQDKAYHPDIKEQIKGINEKILELSNQNQDKSENETPLFNPKTQNHGEETKGNAEAEGQVTPEKPSEGAATIEPTALPNSFLESRHADTVDDEKGLVSGPNDNPLSKEGKRDANDLANDVKDKGVTKVITSDLERAKQTGRTVAEKTGATIEHRTELNTWDIGEFDKSSDAEFKKVQDYFVSHPNDTKLGQSLSDEDFAEKYLDKNDFKKWSDLDIKNDEKAKQFLDQKREGEKSVNETFNQYKNRVINARSELEKEPASTLVINHSNNMMLWDAYVKNGHQWNEQAAKDYLNAKAPEPATIQDRSNSYPKISNVKLKSTDNAVQEKNVVNSTKSSQHGELQSNKNQFQEGAQAQSGVNKKMEDYGSKEERQRRMEATSAWLEGIASGDKEKIQNAEAELVRQQDIAKGDKEGGRPILDNNDREWQAVRTQSSHGTEVGSEASQDRARPSQGSERTEQSPGQFGNSQPNEAQRDSPSRASIRSMVQAIFKMRDMRNTIAQTRWARTLQRVLSENPSERPEVEKIIHQEIKKYQNALQKSKTNEVYERQSGDAGIEGGRRGRMEPSQQGNEPAGVGPEVQQPASGSNEQAAQGPGQEEPATGNVAPPEKGEDWPFVEEPEDSEFTSIRNAVTAQKIEDYGLMPAMRAAKREFGTVWDEAIKKINDGYNVEKRLIDPLSKKARPLTDLENAMLLYHQNIKESQLTNASKELDQARLSGDKGAISEWYTTRAKLLDDMQKIYDVDKAVGTLNARGLASRKMMADRRFSIINMHLETQASHGEVRLTEEQQAEIQQQHDEIKRTKDEYEQAIEKLRKENASLQAEKAFLKDRRGMQAEQKQSARKQKSADIKKDLSGNIQELRDILKQQRGKLSANPIPVEALPILAKMAKNVLKLGVVGFENIVDQVYDAIKDEFTGLNKGHVRDALVAASDKSQTEAYKNGTMDSLHEFRKSGETNEVIGKLYRDMVSKKAAYNKVVNQYESGLKQAEEKERNIFQKTLDIGVKWERGFKLSNPITIAKLAQAAIIRLAQTPIESAVGAGYSAIFKGLAKRAEGEGGINVAAAAHAYKTAFMNALTDASNIFKKGNAGKGELDQAFGKVGQLPPEAIDFFGHLHSAVKAPVKRFAFERSLEKRLQKSINNGVDVTDPAVATSILNSAYKDANRAIFMQDNAVTRAYQNFVSGLERDVKNPNFSKATAATLKFLLPFVKVPTNIVGEVGQHVAGLEIAACQALYYAFTKGIKNLSSDEADSVMRNMKKGTIGTVALLIGYNHPQQFGGYYVPADKKKPKDLKSGEMKLFGKRIPLWALEAPVFQAMQVGATIRRVADIKEHGERGGLISGSAEGLLGMVEKEPLIEEPAMMFGALKPGHERAFFLSSLAKSTMDPALVDFIAKLSDPKDKRSVAEKLVYPDDIRKPDQKHGLGKQIVQSVESGWPGLRENVPLKKK